MNNNSKEKRDFMNTMDTMCVMLSTGGFCAEVAEEEMKKFVHPSLIEMMEDNPNRYSVEEWKEASRILEKTEKYQGAARDFREWFLKAEKEYREKKGNMEEDLYGFSNQPIRAYLPNDIFTQMEAEIVTESWGLNEEGVCRSDDEIADMKQFSGPACYISCVVKHAAEYLKSVGEMREFSNYVKDYQKRKDKSKEFPESLFSERGKGGKKR